MSSQPSASKPYDLPHEEEVLQVLRDFGVKRARLFGRAVRGELRPDSDIDVLVEFDGPINYLDLMFISESIEQITGRSADVVADVRQELRRHIEPDLNALPL